MSRMRACPGVGPGEVRAGGDDVVVVVGGAVDGVDGVGEDLRGGVSAGGVGADPVGVERGDLGGDADAVDGGPGRPGVAGDLGGDVPGEVGGVGGVPGEGEGVVLAVEQPGVAGVGGADGDQQRVGGGLVRDELAQGLRVGGGGQRPGAPVAQVSPRGGQRVAALLRWRVMSVRGELDGGELGHGLAVPGPGGREAAQGVVEELDGWGGDRAEGGQGLLHRGQRAGVGWRWCGRGGGAAAARRGVGAAGSTWTRPGRARRPGRRAATARAPQLGSAAGVLGWSGLAGLGCGGPTGRGRCRGCVGAGGALVGLCRGPGGGGPGRGREGVRLRPGRLGGGGRPARSLWLPCVLGDGQGPPDVDDVRVAQVRPAGLGDVPGGVEDLGVAAGVAELLVGDAGQGVALLHRVRALLPEVRPARSGAGRVSTVPGRRNPGRPPRVSVLRSAISG